MLKHLNSKPVAPKRVVVIGSNGFVGSTIMKNLKESEIVALGISKNDINLLDQDAADRLAKILKPEDAIIFVSALAPCKNNTMLLDNLRMCLAVTNALEKSPVSHLIYISSDAVYADDVSLATEHSNTAPSSLHGMMHSARELMLKQLKNIPLAILRPSLLYGANDPHNGYGPNRFRRLAEENKLITLFGNGEEQRDHIFVEDVAQIVNLVLQHESEGILNVVTGQSLSFRETAEIVVDLLKANCEVQGTPRQNPITHRHFNIAACHKAFPSFCYKPFKEGIKKVIEQVKRS